LRHEIGADLCPDIEQGEALHRIDDVIRLGRVPLDVPVAEIVFGHSVVGLTASGDPHAVDVLPELLVDAGGDI
jgi:hypothetical protein